MKYVLAISIALALAACSQEPVEGDAVASADAFDPTTAQLAIEAVSQGDTKVEFTITTNIPTPVEVMAGVALQGQKPDDVFIGHSERITLEGPETTFILDTTQASEPLPTGEYFAEVNFYNRWGSENGNPAAKVVADLEASTTLALGGSGEERGDVERRNELQRWVMLNVDMNTPWNLEDYESRLGPAQKGPSTLSPLHDAYYFREADITLLVNRLKNELTVWRMGEVTE